MISYRDNSDVVTVAELRDSNNGIKGDKIRSQVFEFINDETSSGEVRKVTILVVYTWVQDQGNSIKQLQVTTIKQ